MNIEAKDRVAWIDCAKGIAIVLTIVGHTMGYTKGESFVRGMVFSFHMPLFFIVSMITYRCSENMEQFKAKGRKAATHLLKPAIITFVISVIFTIWQNAQIISKEYFTSKLYTLLYASGVETQYYDQYVPAMGIQWFFFALLIGRTIFDFLHMNIESEGRLFIVSIIVGLLGIVIGQMNYLPFSFDIALAIMPLFFVGFMMKSIRMEQKIIQRSLVSLIIWGVTLWLMFPNANRWTYLELAARRYPMFPLCYITAVAGTIFISEMSVLFCKLRTVSKPIVWLGKNSMWLLCIHILDPYWAPIWQKESIGKTTAYRVIIDIGLFAIVMLWQYVWKKGKALVTKGCTK